MLFRFRVFPALLSTLFAVVPFTLCAESTFAPIPVKVVIVTMFEVGTDTGDTPGELQHWVERDHLDRIYPLPAAYHDARMNDSGELAIVTGQGTAHAAATIMALGLDPRFDLSHAYWIVAGIAGGSPERASLASAAWAEWVVDSDLGYEIDAREIPQNWPTGIVPLHRTTPYEQPVDSSAGQVYHLNPHLVDWAYTLTRNLTLPDNDTLRERRSHFSQTAAQASPHVLKGDTLSGSTYWHGALKDRWASEWMRYYTGNQGTYVTTAMEDTGTMQSLTQLAKAGRVDLNRVLILRTISNYDQQAVGLTAAESLAMQKAGTYGAFLPSLESAYITGHAVAAELLQHWDKYRDKLP